MCALLLRCERRFFFWNLGIFFFVKALHCMITNSRKCLKQFSKIGELISICFTDYMFLCKPLQSFVIFISKTVDVVFILHSTSLKHQPQALFWGSFSIFTFRIWKIFNISEKTHRVSIFWIGHPFRIWKMEI